MARLDWPRPQGGILMIIAEGPGSADAVNNLGFSYLLRRL
jgi:hypothetical protein